MKILEGNNLETLRTLADNSVDSIVTDPPYGLAFMGKKWDYDVPSVDFWREVLRVLKPGGHVLSFGGTRTYHRMVVNMEDAGFEIRDQLQWLYGSGFPKSLDVSKAFLKQANNINLEHQDRCEALELSEHFNGWGTALKPANEPIVLARKPLIGTVVENVATFLTGGLNIDASRIGYSALENIDFSKVQDGNIYGANGVYGKAKQKQTTPLFKENGRWPANVILDEEAAAVLDAQTAEKQLASRFFYVAKASKRERGEGNVHPTVKPVKLMEYLVRLITPPGGTVLDPFMGSGTTGVASKRLGFQFIGCELDPAYITIAKQRIEAAKETT